MTKDDAHPHDGARPEDAPRSKRSPMAHSAVAILDEAADVASLDGNAAESIGWRCLFAARVAVQHLDALSDPERVLAILTNKIAEVAQRFGHWALRERLFDVEHVYRVRSAPGGSDAQAWHPDRDDLGTLMGTMGRFPEFRRTGWDILRAIRSARQETERV